MAERHSHVDEISSNIAKQTHKLVKSLIDHHAEAFPAGMDHAARYESLCADLLAHFGFDRMSDFTINHVNEIRRWLAQETAPVIIKDIRATRKRLRLKWNGVYAFIQEIETLHKLARPISGALVDLVKSVNPSCQAVLDPTVDMLVDHGLRDINNNLWRVSQEVDRIAGGLEGLAEALGLGREEEAEAEAVDGDADEPEGGADE